MIATIRGARLAVLLVRELARAIHRCPRCAGAGVDGRGACGRCQGAGEVLNATKFIEDIRALARGEEGDAIDG